MTSRSALFLGAYAALTVVLVGAIIYHNSSHVQLQYFLGADVSAPGADISTPSPDVSQSKDEGYGGCLSPYMSIASINPGTLFPQVWQCPQKDIPPVNINTVARYSQSNEDKAIFENFFASPLKTQGFFLELGALNGVLYSNTKFFEDSLDWRGVLIEAQPGNAQQLMTFRPKSAKFAMAVCPPETGTLQFAGGSATGGAVKDMTEKHRTAWVGDVPAINVLCAPLGSYLRLVGIDRIDFFSLDVEGGELSVLQTFDWSIPVRLLLVELTDPVQSKPVRDLILSKGFVPSTVNLRSYCTGDCAENELFVNPNYVDRPFEPKYANHFGKALDCK